MPFSKTRLSTSSHTCVLALITHAPISILTLLTRLLQLHQLTPPILTCLLTSALPTISPSPSTTALIIRTSSASLLHLLISRYAQSYPSLLPRITKTLLRGLCEANRGLGGRWGAARGLSGLIRDGGNRAVRDWVSGSLAELGAMIEREEESEVGERQELVREVLVSSPSILQSRARLTGRSLTRLI